MTRLYVDGPTLIRAVSAATTNLERHVDEVDSLNVFPVPDGDTGSNMLATMRAALAEAEGLPADQRDLDSVAEALSRGALTGARGNSGVILSQIIRGMTHGADGRRRASGVDLAEGLRKGSEVAYESVLTPVEGTILTVIRDAADAAETAAGRQPHVEAVLTDVIEAAASSVQRTPMLLPVLEDAGVVDSGGQGLYRVFEGMLQVEGGARHAVAARRMARVAIADGAPAAVGHDMHAGHDHAGHLSGDEHGYETQYMLSSPEGAIDVPALREAILAVGDSVVVAGDERLARVHVHGERPDLAVAVGLRWGRLSQVDITDLDDQVAHHTGAAPDAGAAPVPARLGPAPVAAPSAAPAIALVAVTVASGLAQVFESFGARVVRPGHGTRPSVGEITAGILAAGANQVIVLPNDRDAVLAAGQAASLTPLVDARVIPTRNAAEGIAAAVTFDLRASLADNVERMGEESSTLRSFTVITAAKDSIVDGTELKQGQIIALDAARHLLAVGDDVADVTLEALALYEGFELVTCYCGNSEGPSKSQALCERIEQGGWAAEIEIVPGGQPHDHLLVAVE
ncbi:MAG: DAK2 domain-containing protein [Chloroflexota bacterium]|nr:DAK2 domain-containing protein [Chloroflexota bacterium]